MKKILVLSSLCVFMTISLMAQKADTTAVKKEAPAKTGPKSFKDFISKKAITKSGLFTTHFMD
jgi:hypothetical protein